MLRKKTKTIVGDDVVVKSEPKKFSSKIDSKKESKLKRIFGFRSIKGLYDFYTEMLSAYNAADIEVLDTKLSEGVVFYTPKKIYTKNGIRRVFIINEFPPYVDKMLFLYIRSFVESMNVKVNFILKAVPYKLNLGSPKIKRRQRLWRDRYNEVERRRASLSRTDKVFQEQQSRVTDTITDRMIKSWEFMRDVIDNKNELVLIRLCIEVASNNEDDLQKACDILKVMLKSNDFIFNESIFQTFEYDKEYNISKCSSSELLDKLNPMYILSDSIVSKFNPIYHGYSGDTKGVYIGMDVNSYTPYLKDFSKGAKAQNILFMAETGGGKSTLIKNFMIFSKLNGYCIICVDYEGDEYRLTWQKLGAKIIDLRGGLYFDTTEIGDITGDPDIDFFLKDEAIRLTLRVFSLLYDVDNGMSITQEAIFSDAINNLYRKCGVTEDPETWSNSKGLLFSDVYDEIVNLFYDDEYLKEHGYEQYKEECRLLVDGLRVYFSETGMKKSMLKTNLSVNDIKSEDMIIISFGMKGENTTFVDKREAVLKQMTISYLCSLLANHNKTVKKTNTVIVLEELQRYLREELSSDIVINLFSGARKRNAILLGAINIPKDVVKDELKGADSLYESASTLIIGKIKASTIDMLIEKFGMESSVKNTLENIRTLPEFDHCFLIFDDLKKYSLIKLELPKELAESSLFKTREAVLDKV